MEPLYIGRVADAPLLDGHIGHKTCKGRVRDAPLQGEILHTSTRNAAAGGIFAARIAGKIVATTVTTTPTAIA